MSYAALLARTRVLADEKKDARRKAFLLCSKLAAFKVKCRSLKAKVIESAARGEVKRLTDEIDSGKFKDRAA